MQIPILAFALSSFLFLPAPSLAPAAPASFFGPPLLCQQLDIGSARSLPWGDGDPLPGYDRSKLAADVGELLKTERDLVVRTETLRRAVWYVHDDPARAWELVGRASSIALERAAAGERPSAAMWYDTGYLVAALRQMGVDLRFRVGVAEGTDGYAYLLAARDAARAEKSDQLATVELVCALATHPAMRGGGDADDVERFERHLEAARAAAPEGTLVARNLAVLEKRFGLEATGVRAKKAKG